MTTPQLVDSSRRNRARAWRDKREKVINKLKSKLNKARINLEDILYAREVAPSAPQTPAKGKAKSPKQEQNAENEENEKNVGPGTYLLWACPLFISSSNAPFPPPAFSHVPPLPDHQTILKHKTACEIVIGAQKGGEDAVADAIIKDFEAARTKVREEKGTEKLGGRGEGRAQAQEQREKRE